MDERIFRPELMGLTLHGDGARTAGALVTRGRGRALPVGRA
jgi:hypothetical protein